MCVFFYGKFRTNSLANFHFHAIWKKRIKLVRTRFLVLFAFAFVLKISRNSLKYSFSNHEFYDSSIILLDCTMTATTATIVNGNCVSDETNNNANNNIDNRFNPFASAEQRGENRGTICCSHLPAPAPSQMSIPICAECTKRECLLFRLQRISNFNFNDLDI